MIKIGLKSQTRKKIRDLKLKVPELFSGVYEGFAINFINKNYWRVQRISSREDIYCDVRLIYYDCIERYLTYVDTPEWFMSLYKRSVENHFNILSKKNFFEEQLIEKGDIYEGDLIKRYEVNEGFLQCMLDTAPDILQELFSTYMDIDIEEWNQIEKWWKEKLGKKKIDKDVFFSSIMGFEEKLNLEKLFLDYFVINNC